MKLPLTVAVGVLALIFGSYYYGIQVGVSTEQAKYTEVIKEMEEAYEKRKNLYLSSIKERDTKVDQLSRDLSTRIDEITKLKEVSDDPCVNAIIPTTFK